MSFTICFDEIGFYEEINTELVMVKGSSPHTSQRLDDIITDSKFDEKMKDKNIFAIDSLPSFDPFSPNLPLIMIKRPKCMGEWDPLKTDSVPFSVRGLKLENSNESVREMLMASKCHLAYIIERKQEEKNNDNRGKSTKTNSRHQVLYSCK